MEASAGQHNDNEDKNVMGYALPRQENESVHVGPAVRDNRHDQQARIAARHHNHSHPGEPRTGMISRLEFQQGTTASVAVARAACFF
jgi:hypothetical protein